MCYIDTDIFIACLKRDDIHKDIAVNVEAMFNTSNYELESNSLDRPLPKEKKSNRINEIWIRQKNHGKRAKIYSYLTDNDSEDKKAKVSKSCIIKRTTQLENKINYLEKNEINIDGLKISLTIYKKQ